jgi:hypothetical protein
MPDSLTEFALTYLDREHSALSEAVREGRIHVASPREAGLR